MPKTYSLLDILPIYKHSSKPDITNPEQKQSTPPLLIEGAIKEVTLTVHERDPRARKECIAHYGPRCYICGFDFSEKYGTDFQGLIHVHHIIPLSTKSTPYNVDPINDLIPVCPNCHLVLHSNPTGAYTPEEIKQLIKPRFAP